MHASLRSAALAALVGVGFCGLLFHSARAQQAATQPAGGEQATAVEKPISRSLFGRSSTERSVEADDKDAGDAKRSSSSKRLRKPLKNRYATPDPALELIDPRTYRLRVVVRISAPEEGVRNIVATCPIPMEWPEQKVRLLDETLEPASARVTEQVMPGQAALIKFQVPRIDKGESASVERMYEITRYRTRFTLPPEELAMPRRTPPELREQLRGIPPGVQINDQKMIELASTLTTANQQDGPWATAKSFWSWTRDNVKFENGNFRGAMHAIDHRCGDCEEMTALFVGLCRLAKIPARTVWVHEHDYPEFYLVDSQGKGHWIPAQVLGPAWFGEMAEYRPIFQKGDRFYDPLKKEYVRYVPQTVKGGGATILPQVEFRHEILADSDINAPTYDVR